MYLHELKIWNFRKYGTSDNEDIKTDNPGLVVNFNKKLNLLVGENDSGKTAIIDAIKQVLLTKSQEYLRLDEKDFYKGADERTDKLKIECVFRDFHKDGKEAANFLEWIGFNDNNEYELKLWLYAERKENRIITDIKAGADNEGTQLDGNARDLLRITYLKPLRDALAELTPGYRSRFAQILKSHELFQKKKDEEHKLEGIVKEANYEIKKYFKEGDAKSIKVKIDEYLNDDNFFPKGEGKVSFIEIAGSELSDILNKLSLNIDNNKGGLGSLNLLFIAAELLLLETESKNGLQLALIEEIEAHLHAQAQLRLIEYLQNQKGQFILTTHSITLASKINLENLIICKGDKVFPMGNKHTQLEKGDYKFLQCFLDTTKANLFFARGVVIVEGDAENLLIPTIAEIIGKPLHKYGVSIVNVGSTAFKRYAKVFLRKNKDNELNIKDWLDIPVAIITDLDERPIEYYEDADNEKQKSGYQINDSNIRDLEEITNDINFVNIKNVVFTSESDFDKALSKERSKNIKKEIRNKIKEKVKFNDITEEIIEIIRNKKFKEKTSEYKKQNARTFVAENWTLEYEIAVSELREYFYEAVLRAEKLQNDNTLELQQEDIKAVKEECKTFFITQKAKSNTKIAYEIYKPLIQKSNKISKAITAQCFAEILIENQRNVKEKFETEKTPLSYLYNSIIYATTNEYKDDERN
ncbi:MAG: AAA family ATPase [Bacteroidales bacterium]|nr:AAA family ATPase [Bacteroidales bacterium]